MFKGLTPVRLPLFMIGHTLHAKASMVREFAQKACLGRRIMLFSVIHRPLITFFSGSVLGMIMGISAVGAVGQKHGCLRVPTISLPRAHVRFETSMALTCQVMKRMIFPTIWAGNGPGGFHQLFALKIWEYTNCRQQNSVLCISI